VVSSIMPDWLPLLKQSAGVIAEQGGMTSHGAIVARELGIPAVVGANQASQKIRTGDWLLVDGDRGEIYSVAADLVEKIHPTPPSFMNIPPIATRLMVNLSQSERLDWVAKLPIDGIGLLRSELMIPSILEGQPLDLWLQKGRKAELVNRLADQIRQFAAAFAPRPVFYRSLDLRSHEFRSLLSSETTAPEANPMLGNRGTLSYQSNPALFEVELAALYQVCQTHANLRLILPFVRTVEEFVFCRQQIEQAGLTGYPHFQLWIMAEVPSVLFLLPDYVQAGVQGISIGTNDLTQLLLGVDRDQSEMATSFNENHPAVKRAITYLLKTARQLNIPCSICGAAPVQHPGFIDHLIQQGITSISVDASAVEATHQAIARAELRLLVERAQRGEG
jgi:pyruvate, water dikinase